jgi:putative FmdB family regulatory protein
MPIYDYKCQECGEVVELLMSVPGDSEIPVCPHCGSHNMEKLVSAPSLLRYRTNSGTTCCGREERCEKPPCSTGERCHRH